MADTVNLAAVYKVLDNFVPEFWQIGSLNTRKHFNLLNWIEKQVSLQLSPSVLWPFRRKVL